MMMIRIIRRIIFITILISTSNVVFAQSESDEITVHMTASPDEDDEEGEEGEENEDNKENYPRRHKLPSGRFVFFISNKGVQSLSQDVSSIHLYEIADINGNVIITCQDSIEFSSLLFSLNGEYMIRFHLPDIILQGEITLL